jgi:hypothetical protein
VLKILADQRAQVSVRQGCNTILEVDCVTLQHKRFLAQRRAVHVNHTESCVLCLAPIFRRRTAEPVVVFRCKHIYHAACIEAHRVSRHAEVACVRCQSQTGSAVGVGSPRQKKTGV